MAAVFNSNALQGTCVALVAELVEDFVVYKFRPRPNYWVHETARTYYSSLHASSPYANALSLDHEGKQVLSMNVRYLRSEEVAPLFCLAVIGINFIQFGFFIMLGVDF